MSSKPRSSSPKEVKHQQIYGTGAATNNTTPYATLTPSRTYSTANMPRMTRAKAAEVADKLHVDEDAVLELPSEIADATMLKTPEAVERTPLIDIAPNSGGTMDDSVNMELKKSTRARKGGKTAKGRKVDSTALDEEETVESVATPDMDAVSGAEEMSFEREASVVVSEAATEMTQPETLTAFDAPPSPLPTAMPNIIASLRKETPGKRSTSNKENVEPIESPMPSILTPRQALPYDALEQAVVEASTPPASSSRRPSAVEIVTEEPMPAPTEPHPEIITAAPASADPITDLDALDEALEKVTLEVPNVHSTPEKPTAKKAKPVPIVRTTKASLARLSLAQAEKEARTSILGRSSSVRQSTVIKPSTASERLVASISSARRPLHEPRQPPAPRIVSASRPTPQAVVRESSTTKPTSPREKREVVIPHSKPRPVSLSFPTPPPPPKSKKAPTVSSFQLPGEAVAARLKAARHERAPKVEEAETVKKPAFKARPVPASLTRAPSIKPTVAIRARESLMPGSKAPSTTATTGTAHKRAQSTITSSTGPRASLRGGPLADLSIARQRPRPSTAMAGTGAPRASVGVSGLRNGEMAPPSATARGGRVASAGTSKGKEVFQRAAANKAAEEKERKLKEEAAKQARKEASERGRVLSREWAEKQKARKAAAAAKPARESMAANGGGVVA
ncbi:hypothetical protein LTR56_004770 [Elasticomyces elasticus]|nr:hypothetical protein LTR56_004770 [Elasticomyces elasticus]KAK3665626.1 hypothetical protein LTR22_003566 [Elasticomyces elasticus]KAK5768937.1 hypothetical protein LTS12_000997 [Elasticomyces elasticus]